MARIEMQNDHESQPAVGRHGPEKAVQGVDAARRCADAHDWRAGVFPFGRERVGFSCQLNNTPR